MRLSKLILILGTVLLHGASLLSASTYDGTFHSTYGFIKMVKTGNQEYVKLFIERGINVNLKTDNDLTPLMWATITRQAAIVDLLLANKADVQMQDRDGYSALMWAIRYGHTEIVRTLMKAGASIQQKERNFGWTPLFLAAYYGDSETTAALIQAGADIQLKDYKGWTALMLAQSMGNPEIVRLLRQEGASEWLCQPLIQTGDVGTICLDSAITQAF